MVPGYFHFPLCLLSFEPKSDRLQSIVSYCVVEHAETKTNAGIKASANFLFVNLSSIDATREQWQIARDLVLRHEEVHGRDPFVRISTELLGECHKGKLSYRDFSILCAINSQIGSKKHPVRITQPSIRVRAAGYKSWRVFVAAVPLDRREEALLAPHKVRYTVESLHRRKFFAKARRGPRTVLFMNRVTNEELRETVVKQAARRFRFRRECQERDAEMRRTIKGLKAINDVKRAINGETFSTETASTNSPHANDTSRDGAHHINNSVSNSSVLNNSQLNNSVTNIIKPVPLLKQEHGEKGYLIDDVFVPQKEANRLAQEAEDPMQIINSARPAVRINGSTIRELK